MYMMTSLFLALCALTIAGAEPLTFWVDPTCLAKGPLFFDIVRDMQYLASTAYRRHMLRNDDPTFQRSFYIVFGIAQGDLLRIPFYQSQTWGNPFSHVRSELIAHDNRHLTAYFQC